MNGFLQTSPFTDFTYYVSDFNTKLQNNFHVTRLFAVSKMFAKCRTAIWECFFHCGNFSSSAVLGKHEIPYAHNKRTPVGIMMRGTCHARWQSGKKMMRRICQLQ